MSHIVLLSVSPTVRTFNTNCYKHCRELLFWRPWWRGWRNRLTHRGPFSTTDFSLSLIKVKSQPTGDLEIFCPYYFIIHPHRIVLQYHEFATCSKWVLHTSFVCHRHFNQFHWQYIGFSWKACLKTYIHTDLERQGLTTCGQSIPSHHCVCLNILTLLGHQSAILKKKLLPFCHICIIFTHLKLWIALARHNFKWVKIQIE